MRYLFVLAFVLLIASNVRAQQYSVVLAKKVSTLDGKKIKKGGLLTGRDTIFVAEKGEIMLKVASPMPLRLAPGTYQVGFEATRHTAWYAKHLELTKYLKDIGMISCKFRYKTLAVPGSDRHYEVDRIELAETKLLRVQSESDSVRIKWFNPERSFKGTYYVIVRDFYNQGFVDILETTETELVLYPGVYGHRHLVYNVLASNCRASFRYKIEAKHVKQVYLGETNYLQPPGEQGGG